MDEPKAIDGDHRTKAVSSIVCFCNNEHYDLDNFKVGVGNSTELLGWIDGHIEKCHKPNDVVTLTLCLGGEEANEKT